MKNKPKSLLYIILDSLAVAGMLFFVKDMGRDIPIFEKIFFKNVLCVIVVFSLLKIKKIPISGNRKNRKPMILRGFIGGMAVYLQFYTVSLLKLSDSAVLLKTVPFFITIIAVLFLKEKLSTIQIPALIISFVGVLFIVRPGYNIQLVPSMIALVSAFLAAISYSIVKHVKNNRENTLVVIFYFTGINLLFSLPMTIMNYRIPNPHQLFDLILLGVCLFIGQFALTKAYEYAPASEVSIYSYFTVLAASLIAFVVWGEIPNVFTAIGVLLIVLSSYLIYKFNRVPKNKLTVSYHN